MDDHHTLHWIERAVRNGELTPEKAEILRQDEQLTAELEELMKYEPGWIPLRITRLP